MLLAFVCALTCAFAFTACGDGTEGDNTSVTPLTENTDFDALVSDKVTEDEWETAFSESALDNCTIKLADFGDEVVLKIDDNYRYMYAFGSGVYLIERDGNYYMFMYNDGAVVENSNWPSMDNSERAWYFSYSMVCADFGRNYDLFTYDEDKGEYICGSTIQTNSIMEPGGKRNYTDIHIKFYNKKLACISIENKKTEIRIYDNGATQVVVRPL